VFFEESAMRLGFAVSALGLCLCVITVQRAITQTSTPAAATAPAAAATPSQAAGSAPPAANDAAAKHAKRTACLKDAKTKKLVGAEKSAFLKDCIAAP
jgi:psiF repeat